MDDKDRARRLLQYLGQPRQRLTARVGTAPEHDQVGMNIRCHPNELVAHGTCSDIHIDQSAERFPEDALAECLTDRREGWR
jgi:hypothetical protein